MMSEVQHYEDQEDDGLSSFSLDQLGARKSAFGSARILKFNGGLFVTREGEVVPPERELLVLGLLKVVQKFVKNKLIDTIPIPPREPFPDLDEMNANAPREEWGVDLNGKPAGPFTRLLVLKLLDARTMDRYAFISQSIGGGIAIGDITDKIKIMRRIRGANVTAVVNCRSATMKSSYNPRGVPRPDFAVNRWIALAAPPEAVAATPAKALPPTAAAVATSEAPTTTPEATAPSKPTAAPETAAPPKPAAPEPTVVDTTNIGTVVLPPTLKEELDDTVPF
jgi:hypothetical protein